MCLTPPVNQSTPALVSSISPQSSSDLDTDQGDLMEETIKQVAQSLHQMLLKISTGNPISSLTQNDPPHTTKIQTCRQSVTLPSDIHSQIHSQFILTDQPHLRTALHIQIQVMNKPNKL